MKGRIDFSLSGRYGIVEKTIFRLVLSGVNDVETIRSLMRVYSDTVIANAIKSLVNDQVLHADLERRAVFVSEPLMALIESCMRQSQTLEIPEEKVPALLADGIMNINRDAKPQIMRALLPGINAEFLVRNLDFVLLERSEENE